MEMANVIFFVYTETHEKYENLILIGVSVEIPIEIKHVETIIIFEGEQ